MRKLIYVSTLIALFMGIITTAQAAAQANLSMLQINSIAVGLHQKHGINTKAIKAELSSKNLSTSDVKKIIAAVVAWDEATSTGDESGAPEGDSKSGAAAGSGGGGGGAAAAAANARPNRMTLAQATAAADAANNRILDDPVLSLLLARQQIKLHTPKDYLVPEPEPKPITREGARKLAEMLYKQHGFNIAVIQTDPTFQTLTTDNENVFWNALLNLYAQSPDPAPVAAPIGAFPQNPGLAMEQIDELALRLFKYYKEFAQATYKEYVLLVPDIAANPEVLALLPADRKKFWRAIWNLDEGDNHK